MRRTSSVVKKRFGRAEEVALDEKEQRELDERIARGEEILRGMEEVVLDDLLEEPEPESRRVSLYARLPT